ncbi:hypothetical protein D3C71_1826360 [compost metagenome]
MQQQLPVTARFVVEAVGLFVGWDVRVDQDDFPPFHRRIAFGDIGPTVAQGLDLGAKQLDPGLDIVLEEIVEARAPILGDHLLGRVGGHQTTPASAMA